MTPSFIAIPTCLMLTLSMLLCACHEQESPEQLRAWLTLAEQHAQQTNDNSKVHSGNPSVTTETSLSPYLSAQLRSPFYRHRDDDIERTIALSTTRPPQRGPRQALEEHALESLTLVGTLLSDTDSNALIRAADKIYRIRIGDYLGPHFGQVLRVTANTLELEELLPNDNGGWNPHHRLLYFTRVTP